MRSAGTLSSPLLAGTGLWTAAAADLIVNRSPLGWSQGREWSAAGGRAALGERGACARTQVPVSGSGSAGAREAPGPRSARLPGHPRRHGLRCLRAALHPGALSYSVQGQSRRGRRNLVLAKNPPKTVVKLPLFPYFWLNVRRLASRGFVSWKHWCPKCFFGALLTGSIVFCGCMTSRLLIYCLFYESRIKYVWFWTCLSGLRILTCC